MRLRDIRHTEKLGQLQAGTLRNLAYGVAKMSALLQQFGKEILDGDKRVFDELAKQHEIETIAYNLERDLRHMRDKCAAAWHAKDYAKVADLLKPYESHLTQSELGKLRYARKKLGLFRRILG